MSEQNNRHVVEQAFTALNAHDIDTYLKLLDDSFVSESELSSGPISGPAGVRKMLEMYLAAFPDLHFEIEQILTSGDHVISCYRATGTHKGDFFGITPTNTSITLRGCTVGEMRDGKSIRSRIYADHAKLFQQLGVLSLGKKMAAG
jgi:steroid delta-isomerase-like uncharacterized protein